MGKRITLVLLILLQTLHVGDLSIKDAPLWQLHKYKYTTLLQTEPLTWCPFKSYVLVDRYVTITNRNNCNVLDINADLIALTASDVAYNKAHAKRYKGSTKAKVKKIFRYCSRTKYVAHVKTAHSVFQTRTGDCAGISSAFYVLCKVNHIPCRYVIGWTKTDCHAWNRVRIKGQWYWIDATKGLWLSKKQFKNRTVLEYW